MEEVAGILIHSTVLSVSKCCMATVVMTMRVGESLVPYIYSAHPSCTFL